MKALFPSSPPPALPASSVDQTADRSLARVGQFLRQDWPPPPRAGKFARRRLATAGSLLITVILDVAKRFLIVSGVSAQLGSRVLKRSGSSERETTGLGLPHVIRPFGGPGRDYETAIPCRGRAPPGSNTGYPCRPKSPPRLLAQNSLRPRPLAIQRPAAAPCSSIRQVPRTCCGQLLRAGIVLDQAGFEGRGFSSLGSNSRRSLGAWANWFCLSGFFATSAASR